MVKNSPASAGDLGSIPLPGRSHMDPWSGKIPQATEQLSPCTTTQPNEPQLLKPVCLEPVLHKRSPRDENPMHCNWEKSMQQ